MAGQMVQILRKTSYDMTYLTASQSSVIVLEPYISTLQAREGTLVLRIHSTPSWANGAAVRAALWATDQCPDDPSLLFTEGTELAFVQVAEGDSFTAPYLKRGTVTSGLVGTAGASLKFIQGSQQATFTITVSIDLALKW